ncbi:ROK family protein [Bacillus sp. MUM 116]|uniref:ROK family transcriptional regulator n=1 Tax=Bacillus sp. MUM 116 TaxID=1678002 RepID=UPI0008F5E2B8|nr:ROK family transcriptional regulator [Bacillus sp. MUM 116]OIK08138.1 ROK family protein [Bacillus sp. MUM 116]
MITGDAAYIKKINRSLIIRHIIKEGMISRADLSKVTALTRATISAQVADLLEEGLIVETQLEHNSVGRKPIMLSINRHAGYALGIDLDYGQLSFTLSDLLGQPISSVSIKIDTIDYSEILQLLMGQIKKFQTDYSDSQYGIVGIVIAVHGLVSKDEVIHYVPRLKWDEMNLKRDLATEIDLPIYLENNANVCSFAERVYLHHDTDNLLCTTLYSGIGIGMMMKDEFFRGHDGYAGEAGHMIIVPGGKPCNCGNHGCWEKYASESSIFEYLSEKRKIKNLTYDQIQVWLDEGDAEVHHLMEQLIYYLAIGLNNMINMYNPDVIVLESELLRMFPDSLSKIKRNLTSSISHYRELIISDFGKKSVVLGSCALAIKKFLEVPMLNFTFEEQNEKMKA